MRTKNRVRSSQGKSSRGVSWHQPTASSPSKANKPGGGPCLTIARKARRFLSRGRWWYSLPILQYMHQQPLHAPALPNKSSSAGQRSGISGRMVRFTRVIEATWVAETITAPGLHYATVPGSAGRGEAHRILDGN